MVRIKWILEIKSNEIFEFPLSCKKSFILSIGIQNLLKKLDIIMSCWVWVIWLSCWVMSGMEWSEELDDSTIFGKIYVPIFYTTNFLKDLVNSMKIKKTLCENFVPKLTSKHFVEEGKDKSDLFQLYWKNKNTWNYYLKGNYR